MNECLMTPQHEKQIGYWVSEKGKCMKWCEREKHMCVYVCERMYECVRERKHVCVREERERERMCVCV